MVKNKQKSICITELEREHEIRTGECQAVQTEGTYRYFRKLDDGKGSSLGCLDSHLVDYGQLEYKSYRELILRLIAVRQVSHAFNEILEEKLNGDLDDALALFLFAISYTNFIT